MTFNCCVPGCKTGLKGYEKRPAVSIHSFPSDEQRKVAWVKAIPRDKWTPSPFSRICSLHFDDQDFVTLSQDQNRWRKRRPTGLLKSKHLKANAVPSKFCNEPGDPDQVLTLEDLKKKLENELLPTGVQQIYQEGRAILFSSLSDQTENPLVTFSVCVLKNLSFRMSIRDMAVPSIFQSAKIDRVSTLSNILTFMKSLCKRNEKAEATIDEASHLVHEMTSEDDVTDVQRRKLGLIEEQLTLARAAISLSTVSCHSLDTNLSHQIVDDFGLSSKTSVPSNDNSGGEGAVSKDVPLGRSEMNASLQLCNVLSDNAVLMERNPELVTCLNEVASKEPNSCLPETSNVELVAMLKEPGSDTDKGMNCDGISKNQKRFKLAGDLDLEVTEEEWSK